MPDVEHNDDVKFGIEDYLKIFAMATLGLGGSLFIANLVILGWEGVVEEGLGIGSLIFGGSIIMVMLGRLEKIRERKSSE